MHVTGRAKKIVRALYALLLLYAFIVLFFYFSYWGIGAGIVLLIFIIVLGIAWTVIVYVFSRARHIYRVCMKAVNWLTASRAWRAVDRSMYAVFPRAYRIAGHTFDITTLQGTFLLLGVLVSALFVILFVGVAADVLFHSPLIAADPRIIYLFRTIVSPEASAFFIFIEAFGSVKLVSLIFVAIASFFLYLKRYWWIGYFAALLVSSSALTYGLKWLFERPRPLDMNVISLPNNPSFPSGHAVLSVCAYGFIAYLLARSAKSRTAQMLIALACFALIVLIGMSRIYLGVHYPSDVFGGWYLGLSVLTLIITFNEIDIRLREHRRKRLWHYSHKIFAGIAVILFAAAIGAAIRAYQLVETVTASEVSRSVASLEQFISTTDLYTENLIGDRNAPISFIVVGSGGQIENVFALAGWYGSDPPHLSRVFKLASALSKNKPYHSAPMAPAFHAGATHDLGFQKPTEQNSARQRHHTRYWRSGHTLDGKDIWVATASFDVGMAIGTAINLPTHRIDPNIDAEREYIYEQLMATGRVSRSEKIDLVGYTEGINAVGDHFYTDGQSYILYLQDE